MNNNLYASKNVYTRTLVRTQGTSLLSFALIYDRNSSDYAIIKFGINFLSLARLADKCKFDEFARFDAEELDVMILTHFGPWEA